MESMSNQRPGVYSRYDISSSYSAPRSGSYAAVVAKATGGEIGKVYAITGIQSLREAFQPDTGETALWGCVQILLDSGVTRVLAVAVEGEEYAAALALIEGEENIGAVVCDCERLEELAALKASVERSSAALRERVAFCGGDTAEDALTGAGALNCERVALCCPAVTAAGGNTSRAVYGAAAMAGLVLSRNDPAYNFSGGELAGVAAPQRLEEAQVQALLAAGVTVLESAGGAVECVRALTTSTKSGGETDYSLRSLNAILCIDDVMQNVRAALKASLRGTRLSGRSFQTIQSQVVVALSGRADSGVIESFEPPKAYTHSADPTVCMVELAFRIAQVVNQIHITAHIQV